jgi:Protein of unknown function (DUF551)
MTQAEIKQAAEQYAAKQEVYNPKLKELCIQDFTAGAEANAPKWIPVTERMPAKEGLGVSVDVIFTDGPNVFMGYYHFSRSIWIEPGTVIHDVIAWMPLPSPPNKQP